MKKDKKITVSDSVLKGKVRTRYDFPNPTKEQLERKEKSIKQIKKLNAPVLDTLPVIEDEQSFLPRTAKEISERLKAVMICAVKGEGLSFIEVLSFMAKWNLKDVLTHEEREFIDTENASDEDRIKFAWRYECAHILLWALGYVKELKPPHEICEVGDDVKLFLDNVSHLEENSQLKPMNEILDMNDYYYRLHWAAIDLRLENKKNELINEEIIMERHYALNWLIRYQNQEWDSISTNT